MPINTSQAHASACPRPVLVCRATEASHERECDIVRDGNEIVAETVDDVVAGRAVGLYRVPFTGTTVRRIASDREPACTVSVTGFSRRLSAGARVNRVDPANRQLMYHGMYLFGLGLATGLLEQRFTNVRMGLSAHLEGVMNGTFLIALGAIWPEVRLWAKAKRIAYWTALLGTYLNWLVTTLAAAFGTATDSPISAAGHSGRAWQETLVSAGSLAVAISIITSSVLILWGLRTGALRASSYE
jgi:hydroxylaminobenzene mutase